MCRGVAEMDWLGFMVHVVHNLRFPTKRLMRMEDNDSVEAWKNVLVEQYEFSRRYKRFIPLVPGIVASRNCCFHTSFFEADD